jgi:hypothetical protein
MQVFVVSDKGDMWEQELGDRGSPSSGARTSSHESARVGPKRRWLNRRAPEGERVAAGMASALVAGGGGGGGGGVRSLFVVTARGGLAEWACGTLGTGTGGGDAARPVREGGVDVVEEGASQAGTRSRHGSGSGRSSPDPVHTAECQWRSHGLPPGGSISGGVLAVSAPVGGMLGSVLVVGQDGRVHERRAVVQAESAGAGQHDVPQQKASRAAGVGPHDADGDMPGMHTELSPRAKDEDTRSGLSSLMYIRIRYTRSRGDTTRMWMGISALG